MTGMTRDGTNREDAAREMGFTPQERALYMHHLGNLNGPGGVDNADGSRSTLFAMTSEQDGKHYIIPTVWGGKILEPEAAMDHANKIGIDKFPAYASQTDADARYSQMHTFIAKDPVTVMQPGRIKAMQGRRHTIIGDDGDQSSVIVGDDNVQMAEAFKSAAPLQKGTDRLKEPYTGPWWEKPEFSSPSPKRPKT